jgi:6-pyruvoyltetrahydropterin/6-carboxytetrahydropterin synthase
MLTITRSFQFCAGHRLHRPEWSAERNLEVFGPCANPNGHGHNYELEVSVSGPLDAETGMIMNLRHLKEVVQTRVLADVDHRSLNADVPWMRGVVPTTEQFAERIWQRLLEALGQAAPAVRLESLVLHETPNNKVTKRRE